MKVSFKDFFSRYPFDENRIKDYFILVKNYLYNDIDVIVEKHRILLDYKTTKTLSKFDDNSILNKIYFSNKDVLSYIKGAEQAIEQLIMLSESDNEYVYLRLFQLSIQDYRIKYNI